MRYTAQSSFSFHTKRRVVHNVVFLIHRLFTFYIKVELKIEMSSSVAKWLMDLYPVVKQTDFAGQKYIAVLFDTRHKTFGPCGFSCSLPHVTISPNGRVVLDRTTQLVWAPLMCANPSLNTTNTNSSSQRSKHEKRTEHL